jgi:hypothetical protein
MSESLNFRASPAALYTIIHKNYFCVQEKIECQFNKGHHSKIDDINYDPEQESSNRMCENVNNEGIFRTIEIIFTKDEWESMEIKRRQYKLQSKFYPVKLQWTNIVFDKIYNSVEIGCALKFEYGNKNKLCHGKCDECGMDIEIDIKSIDDDGSVSC